ncbi:Glucosidase II beta subunit, partial [Fasciolopsis buskii]
ERFKCLLTPLSIPWSKVNDDYCDCPDGSDEPGSSACPNGSFFCRDVQYKVVSIPSNFVNDGYIDCCDGSDEHDGRTQHESTCTLLAEAHQKARFAIEQGVMEGHKIYKEFVETLNKRQQEERLAAEKAAAEKSNKTTPDESNEAEPDSIGSVESGVHEQSADSGAAPNEPEVESAHASEIVHGTGEQDSSNIERPPEDSGSIPPTPTEAPVPVDYGPEGGFRMLLEPPGYLEFTDKQYTYRLYPFDKIYQRNKESEWSPQDTSLGRWSGWSYAETDLLRENKYALMLFENGLGCWNGPARSVKVSVHCDSQTEIRSVEEPSRCVYTMELHTPAACFESPEEPNALPLTFSDILLYAVTTLFVLLITRKLFRSAAWVHWFGHDTLRSKLSSTHQLLKTKFGSPDLYLFCFLRSLLDQGTKENESCVNTPLEKKKALNQGLNLLTEEEKEREASVRAAQLSSIFKLMQSQPDRFGDMSIEDMSDQFQKFYVRHCED